MVYGFSFGEWKTGQNHKAAVYLAKFKRMVANKHKKRFHIILVYLFISVKREFRRRFPPAR
jgi:hypothetical protein